ncbi:MAG TPA: CxxxxCH/CxxCH domain-containing protein [Gemmatimonadales bacterium]
MVTTDMRLAALLLAVACGGERTANSQLNGPPLQGHGGAATAAAGPMCVGTDPHAKHINVGLACTVCHPKGGAFGFTNVYTYPRGTSTAGGTLVPPSAGVPATCTVACHSPLGSAPRTISWATPGPLACSTCHDTPAGAHPQLAAGSDCQGCHQTSNHTSGTVALVPHPATWMTRSDPGFHAFAADRGLAACQQCHRSDLSGGVTGFSCARCHDTTDATGKTVAWQTNCTLCHGGTDNATGAPPRTIFGYATDAVRIGAHSSHLAGSDLAPPFGCEVCHVKPVDALSAGHVDQVADGGTPLAKVTFSGLASSGVSPLWDRATATCSSTYCHGGTLGGGSNTTPSWTSIGQGQAACGTCHGLPPPAPHPALAPGDLTRCNQCHPATVDASGAVIKPSLGGKHLDGNVDAVGGHSANWMDTASPGFHAFSANAAIASCTSCHGADLAGGSAGVACARCHDANLPVGVTSWKSNCLMCHGGVDDQSGAPPRATWGRESDPLRVGAHTRHRAGRLTAAFDCGVCHVKPADALAAGHVDEGTAKLTFGGIALSGGAVPSWNRADGTCSATYCHGNYSGIYTYQTWDYSLDQPVLVDVPYSGKKAAPPWTGQPMQCDSCHGNPPWPTGVWHSGRHGGGNQCELCHPDASGLPPGDVVTNPSLHMNGTVEVAPKWENSCIGCH